jgi:pyruvate/2-oxoglutarate dehydrogenase complex dihydrolipoamide acyltransferase (E2) component
MKRKFGDRVDAKKVRKIDGLHNILIDLKPRRCDSDVYINEKVNVTNLVEFIEKHKMDDKNNKLTFFHAFSMAFAKIFYEKPLLNRFICNRTTYERNDVILAFVAKIAFDDESEEVMINIKTDPKDNIYTLRNKISEKVSRIRNNKTDKKENTNDIVDKIGRLPKFFRVPVVGMYKWLDQKGLLPLSMMEDNIYYSSAILSNLGNLKIGSIYHNITNFGTSSIIVTIGQIHKEKIVDKDGKEFIADVCDFGVNCDERISDGYYFATAVKLFEYLIENPELLEGDANEKIEINK